MSTWLSITVIAGAQVISQLISVVGAICQERARAASHCIQMQTAGSSGAIMYESLENGSVLLIIPESAGHEWAAVGRAISGPLREQSLP